MKISKVPLVTPVDQPILAGRLSGKRAFVAVLEALPVMTEPTLVLLDFSLAEYATSSFLAELILPLRDHLRVRPVPGFVALANLADNAREEVEEFLRRSGDAVLSCRISGNDSISDVELLGRLDDKLQSTFELVVQKGEASAVELHDEFKDKASIGPTAWNNRLSALAGKSLLVETAQGRTKKYRPLLEIA
jgi:hypothetical protein